MDSERSTPKAGQTPRAPISLEGERRKALKLIYTVEKVVDHFREKWLFDETDENTDEWLEFINLAKGKQSSYKDPKEFAKDIPRLKNDSGFLGSRVLLIAQLQRVCERARLFEELFESCYQRVEDAMNEYMSKYCHSYVAELEDLDVQCVRDYENGINNWKEEIRTCLRDAESAMDDLNDMVSQGFVEYITSYGQVLHCMYAALDALASTAEPFRSWVTSDEGYIKKIQIELDCLHRQRARINENIRKNTFRIEGSKSQTLRSSFNNKKLGETVQGTVVGRGFCRKREFSFVDKIEMTENILHEKKMELDESQHKLHTRPLHTLVREPSDGMKDKTAKLQQEVNRIEGQLKRMKRGKRDMKETRYHLQKEYHELKNTYDSNEKKAQRQSQEFSEQIQHVHDMNERLKTVERTIKSLRKIIEIKSHPSTVKKIYFQGYLPGQKIDYRDTLREAIDVAAAGVGKDWEKMYQTLPFNPPRDPNKRSQDLDYIDMNFRSIHPPSRQMALRSLDKWTSLSNVTSVNALVRTLRSIKKTEVAKRIEKQVLTVVN